MSGETNNPCFSNSFSGLAGIDGMKWRENRKFGTAILRKLGAGRAVMENWIFVRVTKKLFAWS